MTGTAALRIESAPAGQGTPMQQAGDCDADRPGLCDWGPTAPTVAIYARMALSITKRSVGAIAAHGVHAENEP